MNSKIKSYSTLAIAASVILPMACKKKEYNDPNITDKAINKSFTAVIKPSGNFLAIDSLDFDGNGKFDMGLIIGINKNDSSAAAYTAGLHELAQFLSGSDNMFKTFNSGDIIDSTSAIWEDLAIFHQKNLTNNINKGFAGQGDKLIGFRFRPNNITTTEIYYGWMRVSLSADLKTLVIKDLAYPTQPNIAIKAGAK